MFSIPWYAILIISIPETYLIIDIGSHLFNIRIPPRELLIASVVTGLLEYFYRTFLTFPGANSIALLITPTLILVLLCRLDWWKVGLSVLLGAVVVVGIQSICDAVIFSLLNLSYQDLAVKPWLNIVTFLSSLPFLYRRGSL